MQTSFDLLWRRLLEGGVRPRPARRYLAELRDHLDDLVTEERRAGSAAQDAEARALARLGSFEALADAMIARREFHAWSRKAPVAAYVVAPPVILAAGAVFSVVCVVASAMALRRAGGMDAPLPAWFGQAAAGVVFFVNSGLPILLAWACAAMAIRQKSPWLWPLCGMVVLAALSAALQIDVTLPSPLAHGEIGISGRLGDAPAELANFGVRLALALAPYAGFMLWRAARPGQGLRA
jgi:hypothetical protein